MKTTRNPSQEFNKVEILDVDKIAREMLYASGMEGRHRLNRLPLLDSNEPEPERTR